MPSSLAELVASDELITLASDTGLVMALGNWVLQNTCEQIRAWMDAGIPLVPVALKITGRQFHHSPIVDNVRSTLEKSGVPAHHLLLELVDTGGRVDPDLIAMKFDQLREMGVTVSVDHFSPNHTSLTAFQGDSSDYVVIGRELISDIIKSPRSAAIVKAVISLAQELGVITVAQGVSNAVQLLWLQEAGCDLAQGLQCGEPMTAEDVSTHLSEPVAESDEEVA
jgi:EAL domain-containing protein (putative c-di-GMP-specific phosphodiesterase class I)